MYRIVLIDDEPLILAGIASLICWEEHDCSIVGKATNGHDAINLIMETQPDIVITDIRMPVMNGLELIEACQEKHCEFAFIVLTNLEDFQLAKQAVHLGAVDYLVKLDLQPQMLVQALGRAKEHCSRIESHHNMELYTLLLKDTQSMQERNYFSRLLLSPSDKEYPGLPLDPDVSARYQNAYLILLQMKPEQIHFGHAESYDYPFISNQLLDIVSGIGGRYFSHHTILMPHKDTVLLVVCPKPESDNDKSLTEFCTKVNVALSTYFALTALFGISQKKAETTLLPDAFSEAQSALSHCYYESSLRIAFYKNQNSRLRQPEHREFNINFLKRSMSAAVLENKSQNLKEIFSELSELFTQYKPDKTQAVSACINIYSYLHDLLQNENLEDNTIPYSMDIAEQLSQLGSLDDILQWLNSFCDKICTLLAERKEKRSDKFVYMAKRYIHEHYNEKLTLSDIADYLNISPGYLSTSFSNCMSRTVSDYIAEVKIQHAKELIDSGQFLIYEIANQLGFENAYYFSKVFKKVTGMSPKNYECRQKLDQN